MDRDLGAKAEYAPPNLPAVNPRTPPKSLPRTFPPKARKALNPAPLNPKNPSLPERLTSPRVGHVACLAFRGEGSSTVKLILVFTCIPKPCKIVGDNPRIISKIIGSNP